MGIGGGQAEEQGQARPATEQRMDAVAPREGAQMVRGGRAVSSIRGGPPPCFDGGAVDDEVPRPMTRCRMASRTVRTKIVAQGGAPAWAARFHCWGGLGTQG